MKYLLLILIFIISCDDIERDNILDPKNPASERPQIITVEAFVNTADSLPYAYNSYLLNALNQIKDKYQDRILILEYHRNTSNPVYIDSLMYNGSETLYNLYTARSNKGVPDVFINGSAVRVQGASSTPNSVFRLEQVLDTMVINNSYFTLEPTVSESNNQINVSLKLARLGTTNAEDIIVRAVVVYKIDDNLLKRVVHGIGKSTVINNISQGEIKEITIDPINKPGFQYIDAAVIVMVTSQNEKNIYQSIKVEIP